MVSAHVDDDLFAARRFLPDEVAGHNAWSNLLTMRQYRLLVNETRELTVSNSRFLDWGCGKGLYSALLLHLGAKVCAADIYRSSAVDALERQFPDRYAFRLLTDPAALPADDEEFDVVASIGVLEHVRESGGDETASLREIKRVLRSDGTFLCYHLPAKSSWIDFVARRLGRGGHPYRYCAASVHALFGNAGLDIYRMRRYGCLPRNWLAGVPGRVANMSVVADCLDGLETLLHPLMEPISQNFFCLAKPTRQSS